MLDEETLQCQDSYEWLSDSSDVAECKRRIVSPCSGLLLLECELLLLE